MFETMKTISIAVSEKDYEAFRREARARQRSIAQLIREAMELYRRERLEERTHLNVLPVLAGHRPLTNLPSRSEVYKEIFGERESSL